MKSENTSYKMLDPDNCAMCGMCLNHCPTYKITNNESESPRGRISIIHGLNDSLLEPSESALKHINSCTLCMACETACPAKVDFYKLMTDARNKYFKNQKIVFKIKTILISFLLTKNYIKKFITLIISMLNKKSLKKINRRLFKFMNYTQIQDTYTNIDNESDGNIGIFTGCASKIFQNEVANNCINILKKNNINSEIIKNIECCGSLDYNSGRIEKGIMQKNAAMKEFRKEKYQKIIGYASGCSTFINKNKKDTEYQDATSYVLEILSNNKTNNFKITNKNICVHMPCTTKSAEIDFSKLIKVLNKIPGLKIFTFEDNYCCGAGSQNLIHNKKNSEDIIKPKIEFIKSKKIEFVLTYNVGCSLNFINSINLDNINKVEVMHPITFLNENLV
jgi:glycolate oxidase iron-sulfur subunit